MLKIVKSLILALATFATMAAEHQLEFSYNGGQSDLQVYANEIEVTKYKQESYEGTCYNQVPYEEQECGYETRYRRQCHWRTGRNVCRTEYERRCQYETKYRQRCTTGPSREVCRNVPGQRICRTVNGRQECRQRPGRRVCETRPGRQRCHQEPYQDYVCNSRPVQRCTWEPGRNICEDEPYQDYICRMVTKYRSEPYACTKERTVSYKELEKVTHQIKVNYSGALDKADANFKLKFTNELKSVETAVENLNKSSTQINLQLSKINEVNDYNYESVLEVEFFDLDKARAPLEVIPHNVRVGRKGQFKLEVSELKRLETLNAEIVVYDREKKKLHFKKTIDLLSFNKTLLDNGNTLLSGELKEHGFEKIKKFILGPFEKERKLKVTLTIFPLESTVPGQKLKPVTYTFKTAAKF